MPAAVTKGKPKNEKIWNYAKKQVEKSKGKKSKSFTSLDWGLVMTIYKAAEKKYTGRRLPRKYQSVSGFLARVTAKYILTVVGGGG